MTINLQRAERKTDFWKAVNPPNVGPGLYDKTNASQFDHKRDASAPFNTGKDRNISD